MTRDIVLIAHDIRSCHNVGSLLRTAEGLGVSKIWLTGYTPYPTKPGDTRLPHLSTKISKQINKTALDAEQMIAWEQQDHLLPLLEKLAADGYQLCALEQSGTSITLPDFKPGNKVALLLGREVEGIDQEILKNIPIHLEIPMFGRKESFNVVQAAAMAVYHIRFS